MLQRNFRGRYSHATQNILQEFVCNMEKSYNKFRKNLTERSSSVYKFNQFFSPEQVVIVYFSTNKINREKNGTFNSV